MLVLGICDGHDAGACLLADGALLAAVSEERLSRYKRQAGFPRLAIETCLRIIGVAPDKIESVAVAERTGRAVHRLLDRWYRRTDPNLSMHRRGNLLSMGWQNRIARWPVFSDTDAFFSTKILKSRLFDMNIAAPITLVDHHLTHAVSAARGSGFSEALVVTMDAFGDGCSGTFMRWQNGRLSPLQRIDYPHSPALLYGMVTSYLGYKEGEEGQVAGLAAKGDPESTSPLFDDFFTLTDEGPRLQKHLSLSTLRRYLNGYRPEDVAAGLQKSIERLLVELVRRWVKPDEPTNLCLAGGLFANVRLNQVVAESCRCADLYVFPHMGDGGLCVGAAWTQDENIVADSPMEVFLGPDAGELTESELSAGNVTVDPINDAAMTKTTELLDKGGVVGIARGRMEFGPRALGNRSLLFSAQKPSLAKKLGQALARPEVMPFAPVVREEDLPKVAATPAWTCFRHMTATADALRETAKRFPVAVHTDGSMRIQVVRKTDASLLYAILTAYQKHVDPPLLINTSFNLHTEPIVSGVNRAWELFRQLSLDALLTANHLLVRN